MPIYVYHCSNCDHQFDQYQHFTDDPLTVCPACDRPALHKVYQPVGIVFKGKGFYATDNRSTSGLASGHSKDESSEPAESKTGTGEESKKESKTEDVKPEAKKSSESKKAKENKASAPVANP
ncbi:MAG: FmdB family zinc ribbon protein [Anaerolineaceae bacterium]|nr:FmdB family zinc ribbon protein [Anaerolineaceae bacterium]